MSPANLNQASNHRNWGFYLLLILFIIWFGFLAFFKHANEAILPIKLIQNQISTKHHEIITPVFLIAKPGSRILIGDTLGVKVDSITWNHIQLVENTLKDYSNKSILLNRIKELNTGIDSIDNKLKQIINSININSTQKLGLPKPQLIKVESIVNKDNTKEIQKAEEKLRILQAKYAQKKVEYDELLKASKELTLLRQNKFIQTKVIKYVKLKQAEKNNKIPIQTEAISRNTEKMVLALSKYIRQWKSENIIIADKEGILECIGSSSKTGNCFTVSKFNKQVFAFSNPGVITNDSIYVSLINNDGRVIQRLNAVKDSLIDRFIIQDQSGVLESYSHENKNVRILYKEPRQSYYSWLIERLNYK